MMRQIVLLSVVCMLLVGSAGCGLLYCPYEAGMLCDPEHCPPGCGPMCGHDCGPCCDPCCDPCYGPYCCRPFGGLLSGIFRLFRPVCWCGRSCGERYWGDFHGDPPDCYDPCDRCGNFTGGYYGGSCDYGGEYYGNGSPPVHSPGIARQNATIERARVPRVARPHKATRPAGR